MFVKRSALMTLYVLISLVMTSCSDTDRIQEKELLVTAPLSFEAPLGNELVFKENRISSNEILVSITNRSDRSIFLAYLPSPDNHLVDYFPCVIEKWDEEQGRYMVVNDGGHYAPGLHAIKPGKTIKYSFAESAPGEYRLSFSYLIDESAVRFVHEYSRHISAEESEALSRASYEITSPKLLITQSKD